MAGSRTPLVAGNWKMNKTGSEGVPLVRDIASLVASHVDEVEVAVCPPFTALADVSAAIGGGGLSVKLGAQDCFWEDAGAFTGAISPPMLTALACDYVIVGHSERREFFGETNETVNKKAKAVFGAGMVPIACCGESIEVYEGGGTTTFVRTQITEGLAGLDAESATRLVVAYEPIWAIGTGRTPTAEEANDVARMIRATIGAMYGPPAAMGCRILYGGSVKPDNAAEFFSEPDVDGALVGGASLAADPFAGIVQAAR